MKFFNYQRRSSSVVKVENTPLGGDFPIRVQSMANVSTMDTEQSVNQTIRLIKHGAEYVRFTAQGEREAHQLRRIKERLVALGYNTPLVADIHFNPKAADVAATVVDKVRINPGNYVDKVKTFDTIEYTDDEYQEELLKIRNRFTPFINLCKQHKTAIRIGVNHGSLSDRIMSRYGDTIEGMVASCMEFLRICKDEAFDDVVISMKASNTVVMVQAVRALLKTMHSEGMAYPLHLGVTEAGEGEDGRIKSAVGIGSLLQDGIGDTIRVSLSEEPEKELPVARQLIDYIENRSMAAPIPESDLLSSILNKNEKRHSLSLESIGGNAVPVVISDRRRGGCQVNPDFTPDFLYVGDHLPEQPSKGTHYIVNAKLWDGQEAFYPLFTVSDLKNLEKTHASINFLLLEASKPLDQETIDCLKNNPRFVILLTTSHLNIIGSIRSFICQFIDSGCEHPVIPVLSYDDVDKGLLQIKSAIDLGTLLLDGLIDGAMLVNDSLDPLELDNTTFAILQAARVRISKTEFISCPGCGRTLFDLQKTIFRVKKATSHLKGLKIGIMGCIVNGPGEMADADYGYVGAGRGRISLYKGKVCVKKNILEEEAVDSLIELIKENGDWQNP